MSKSGKIKRSIFTGIIILVFIGLITYFIVDLYVPFKELFLHNEREPLKKALGEYGFMKYVIIALLHTLQVVLTVLPGEPVQLLAGIICGPLFGFCACVSGIFLGNTIIYFALKLFGELQGKEKVHQDKFADLASSEKANSMKSFSWFILGLYFAPAIPYGIIAYTAAKGKMKFPRYILITTLGTIPSIFLCLTASTLLLHYSFYITDLIPAILLGVFILVIAVLVIKNKKKIIKHILDRSIRATAIWLSVMLIITIAMSYFLLTHRLLISFIFFSILVLLIILYSIFNKQVAKLFTRKNMHDFQTSVAKPKPFLLFPLAIILYLFLKLKLHAKAKKNGFKTIKGPAFLLFNHESKYDFLYTFMPLYPHVPNYITAYYYFCNFHFGRLLHTLGCFPKFLYAPDISSIKNTKKVLKRKGIVALAPEGRLCAYGEMESYIPATVKLLKKEKIDVYISKIYGAYFTCPKWAKSSRKGKVEVEYSLLFKGEELDSLSNEEVYKRLYDALYYNEYEWLKDKNITYKSKSMCEGLEQILYICPVCHSEFTYSSKGNQMECSCCHTVVKMDNRYNLISENPLIPTTIRDWYLYQKKIELENSQKEDYMLKSNVTLKHPDPKGQGFVVVGKGYTTLTHEGVRYVGTINGEEKNILFKLEHLPAILYGVNEDFEIYHDNTLFYFVPENIRECVKWSVVEEQMYNDYIKKNNIKEWE